ncbi:hypothetical protein [Streptomyces arenae]|uniref:hypothetical protein n=1 Tax=Streptomyces arenae TaxID=29301 RepID=UPI002658B5BB|nr:hypothetical protein [Streptomyces arenae]MCG7204002.1 hypothetical protein [Streptomyces arenae]
MPGRAGRRCAGVPAQRIHEGAGALLSPGGPADVTGRRATGHQHYDDEEEGE